MYKSKKNLPTLEELKDLLANVTLEDKIVHLFVVDIIFDDINEKTIFFNELYPPIFEKNKIIEHFERSCAQIMSRAEDKKIKTKKTLCTLYSLIQKHIRY